MKYKICILSIPFFLTFSGCTLPLGRTRAFDLVDSYLSNDHRIEDPKGKLIALGDEASPYIAERLNTADTDTKRKLLILISAVGKPTDLVQETLMTATHDEDSSVREVASLTLGKMNPLSPQALTRLIELFADSDPRVKAAAATALGNQATASPEAINALQKLVVDKDPYVSNSALSTLLRIDSAQGTTLAKKISGKIIQRLESDQPAIRLGSAFIISQVPALYRSSEMPITLQLAKEDSALIKAQLAATLVRINTRSSLRVAHPLLLEIIQNNEPRSGARAVAEKALALLKEQRPEAGIETSSPTM